MKIKRGVTILCFSILILFSISFISAGLFNDLFKGITGRATFACTDSDGGLNYTGYGTTCSSTSCYSDSCANSKQLFEFYCGASSVSVRLYNCSIGCLSGAGACIPCRDYYADADNDGYGNPSSKQCLQAVQGNYKVTQAGDCNDANANINAGATEICGDNIDNDCDGSVNEGCAATTPSTTCSDGTPSGQCSTTKPQYCNNGNLVNKCGAPENCGCPSGQTCQADGTCLTVPLPTTPQPEIPGTETPTVPTPSRSTTPSTTTPETTIIPTLKEFHGYIVELSDEPLAVKRKQLEAEAEQNQGRPLARIFGGTTPANLERKTATAGGSLTSKRETFKQNALQKLGKSRVTGTGSVIENSELKASSIITRLISFFFPKTGFAIENGETGELQVLGEYQNIFNGLALNITSEEAGEIKTISGVKAVYPNYKVNISLSESVPLINADDVWQLDANGNDCATSGLPCLTGQGITIGIIDTGVDYNHEDLGGCFGTNCKVVGGWDFANDDANPIDDHGHGTHVAATAAGNGVLKGVAPDAKIYAYKVLDSGGSGYWDDIIAAIERSVDPNQDGNFEDHLDIISLSLGGDGNPDDALSQAIDNGVGLGVVAVIAAGNSGPSENTIGSPGTARKAITVGATDKSDSIAYFSSRGPVTWIDSSGNTKYILKPDVVAPGVNICAAQYDSAWNYRKCLDDSHVAISGTSMATPHVSGAAALLLQKHPDWTPDEIKMALRNTAVDIGENIFAQGYGRIDILNTINLQGIPAIAKIETGEKVYGTINIRGTASGKEFNRYTLYYGIGENPSQWTELITSTTPVENGILYSNFDTTLLNEGDYLIKLVVFNNNGDKSEDKNIMKINNIEITSPWNRGILRRGDIIEIKGRASEFNQISIKYSQGLYFNTEELEDAIWKTDSIEVNTAYNGEGVLARWDTSNLEEDFYNLKLEIGNSQEFIYPLFLDSKLKEGWPIYLDSYDTFLASELYQPEVQDLDGDNKKEIIFVYRAGQGSLEVNLQIAQLIVYNSDGSIKWSKELPSPDGWTPCNKVVGDVDNDGFSEIFVECATQQLCNQKLYGFKHNGDKYGGAEWPLSLEGCDPYTLNIADLNNDGINELIAYGGDRVINIPEQDIRKIVLFIGAEGILRETLIPACDKLSTDQDYARSSAIGNFDNDIDLEVVSPYGCNGVVTYNFDGSFVNGWPKYVDGLIYGDLSVGDINADGYDEVMVPTHPLYYKNELVFSGGLYTLNKNGVLNGWPFNESKEFTAPVALADLDGDKKLEIIAQADNGPRFILNYKGEKFSGWPPQKQPTLGTKPVRSAPVAGDLDGDKKIDAVFKYGGFTSEIYNGRIDALGGVLAYNLGGNPIDLNIKYNQIDALLLEFWPSCATTLITDLEENGKIDLISTSMVSTLNKNVVALYVHELDVPYDPQPTEWPMFMHDSQHTGKYKEISCTDSDGGIDYHAKGYVSSNYNGQNPNNFVYDSCMIPDPRHTNQGIGTLSCSGMNCQVQDFYCNGDVGPYGSFFSCPDGCNDGVCISAPSITTIQTTCTDSDGGMNYNVKGYINTNAPSWTPNVPDTCSLLTAPGSYEDQNSCTGGRCFLVEYYCDNLGYPINVPNRAFYNCPSGCNDGACI